MPDVEKKEGGGVIEPLVTLIIMALSSNVLNSGLTTTHLLTFSAMTGRGTAH